MQEPEALRHQFSRFVMPAGLLAHYTRAEIALNNILPSGTLRMSPYRYMNDPVQNKDLGFMGFDFQRHGIDRPEHRMRVLQERVESTRDDVRLVSFTRDVTTYTGADIVFGSCFVRPRMWDHYGERHAGICLVFNRDRFERRVHELFRDRTYFCEEVRYTPAGWAGSRARSFAHLDLVDDDPRNVAVTAHIARFHEDFFFLKTDDWSSEHEYRVVVLERGEEFSYLPYGDALNAVVLGERFPLELHDHAQTAADTAGVQLLELGWADGRPFVSGFENRSAESG
jgi:hypothetical protein